MGWRGHGSDGRFRAGRVGLTFGASAVDGHWQTRCFRSLIESLHARSRHTLQPFISDNHRESPLPCALYLHSRSVERALQLFLCSSQPPSRTPAKQMLTSTSPFPPRQVIVNGSHSMHAVGDAGVRVLSSDGSERLQISSLDAALVSPGAPVPLPNVMSPPDMRQGVSFNLFNNLWCVAAVEWGCGSGCGGECQL